MTITPVVLPEPDAVLAGPFWPCAVKVIRASLNGTSVRVQAEGTTDGQYYDRILSVEQFSTQVREVAGGTHHFDADPRLFRLAAEALRTHLSHAFDPQFAISVSQVDPLPHQIDAVYRHILPLPRIRFLLADDPGAGKTIMAGLLVRELVQRQDVARVLVLCPKALTDQWRREMFEKFRQRFTLITGDAIAGAFGQNAWVENDLVVASVDLALQEHVLPGLEQANWDMVIFDEAHKLSAYRYGTRGKIDKTKRYQLAEKMAERTKHLLLMTATPHKGDDENFRLLLSLLDPTVFASADGMRHALDPDGSPYFLRRMKESMRHFDGRPLFLPRRVETVAYPLDPHEQDLYEAVTTYVAAGLERAESSQNRPVSLALIVLQRRLASSLYAISRSLERRRNRLADELDRARASGRLTPAVVDLSGLDDDDEDGELDDQQEDAISAASNARTPAELEAEIAQLSRLVEQAKAAMRHGPEKKLRELERVVRSPAVAENGEKLLIFTEHRDTLEYLVSQLRSWGYTVTAIHGGMRLQDRITAEKDFRGGTQFMVATDAAGEGINLQFCKLMLNWDLPWNPNRLEQRMGRIHRYGQDFEVEIVNLVASTTREGAVLTRLMAKLERMRQSLGHDQVYDVIAGVLESGQVRLDALFRAAILNRRSLDDILADLDFVDGDASRVAARQALGEALATSHIDMAFINGEERESKERRLTPEYVERFFLDALRHLGGRAARGADRDWRIEHVPAEIRRLLRGGNTGEQGNENRLVTFRKERLRRDPPSEFIAPGHPLFDAVLGRVLDEGRPALSRGTVFVDREATAPYLLWLLEAAVVNGEGEAVHRRLVALRQRGKTFEPVAPGVILDLPPSATAPQVPQALRGLADADQAVSAAAGFYASDYVAEVTAEQERQAAVVERALQQSVSDTMTRLHDRQERQQERAAAGGTDMRIALRTTSDEIEMLTAGLQQRRAALARRRVTSIDTPRVVGVAAVIPGPVPAAWSQSGGDRTAIEMAAMNVVMEYERQSGREPVDVSKTGVGYDIRSEAPDGSVRYIEVKGHTATGDVTLYYTEWQTAHRMREEFFIYVVDHALTAPSLWIVQDPVGRGVEPTEKVVEYHVSLAQLQAAAVASAPPHGASGGEA